MGILVAHRNDTMNMARSGINSQQGVKAAALTSQSSGLSGPSRVRETSTPIQFARGQSSGRADPKTRSRMAAGTRDRAKAGLYAQKKVVELKAVKSRRYGPGSHGFKKNEQKRLALAHQIAVTGSTHESEHTIGFEPLNRTSGEKRGKGSRARTLENSAPAYQEVKELHRDHIGTGNHGKGSAGWDSEEYRNDQRESFTNNAQTGVSNAVQLNQLGYSFDRNFRSAAKTPEGAAASDSYNSMVGNMDTFQYADHGQNKTVNVDAKQKAEMHLARQVAISGKYPTVDEENHVRKLYGPDPAAVSMDTAPM